jgi:hypothetical protein
MEPGRLTEPSGTPSQSRAAWQLPVRGLGSKETEVTPRGRLPTLWGTNLTLSYPLVIGPATVTLQAYLYNVFNKQIAISKDQAWTISPPDGYPATIYDPNQPSNNPDYGAVTARSDPRLFRAAMKISF